MTDWYIFGKLLHFYFLKLDELGCPGLQEKFSVKCTIGANPRGTSAYRVKTIANHLLVNFKAAAIACQTRDL
jgi:hypothetical protein